MVSRMFRVAASCPQFLEEYSSVSAVIGCLLNAPEGSGWKGYHHKRPSIGIDVRQEV
jgi:hypothetical protein